MNDKFRSLAQAAAVLKRKTRSLESIIQNNLLRVSASNPLLSNCCWGVINQSFFQNPVIVARAWRSNRWIRTAHRKATRNSRVELAPIVDAH